MNVFFKAGRALGRAEFLRLDNRNGAACLREAANDLLRSRVKELAPQAKALSAIAAAWESKKNQILTVTSAIRDQYLSKHDNKGYHAFCSGLLLGLALEGCRNAGKDTVIANARSQIVQWITAARDHALALESQCGVSGMSRFASAFNARASNVSACRQSGQLRAQARYIKDLSSKVGNAIR